MPEQDAALIAHQLADGVLLHELEGVAQDFPVQRGHVVGLTGAVIQVPLFINEGEKIQVDTRTGEYLGRCKE